MKTKAPLKWVLWILLQQHHQNSLISEITFSNYRLIVYAYSKIPKIYGKEIITTEEMMDKLDMFQPRFGK